MNEFNDLMKEQNLRRINIDSRLVDSFKRILGKLQTYFDANGYTSQRDYKKFFEEYLLKDMDSKLRIVVSNEPSKIGAAGFYRTKPGSAEIHIDERYLKDEESLDHVFCHEFIHFLVKRGLNDVKYPNLEIKNGGFINEALTEMLTQQIYPNTLLYQPQVNMLKFANLLRGTVNNYGQFLNGGIDSEYIGASWMNFRTATKAYQKAWEDKGFVMSEAINDPNYISAQQNLIRANIKFGNNSSFNDYKKLVSILVQRPAPDNQFIDEFLINIDKALMRNLGINDENLKNMMYQKLLEFRQIISAIEKYEGKDVYEFEIAGHKVAVDKNVEFYNLDDLSSSLKLAVYRSVGTGIYEVKVGSESIKFDINTIDFSKRKRDLLEREQTISKYFSSISQSDIKSVLQVSQNEGLVKLEKFKLPVVGVNGDKMSTVIYVATYGDRIEILSNPTQIGELQDIKTAQYIGVTSEDLKVGAISSKPLGSINNGIAFSVLNQNHLQLHANRLFNSKFIPKITPTLSSDQIAQLIEQFKLSDEYDPEMKYSAKELQEDAIIHYANSQYSKLSHEQKQSLYDEVIKKYKKFVISTQDGKVDISLLFGDKNTTAFRAESEVLVDTKGNGLYNQEFEILSKSATVRKESVSTVIQTNTDGNIIFSQKKASEEKKTPSELIKEYNQQLANLRAKNVEVAKQIEDLMKQNKLTPIPNYQDKLRKLIEERDKFNKEADTIIHSQNIIQQAVDFEKEQEHNALISQVEALLSMEIGIANESRFVKTNAGMFPQWGPKDKYTLYRELGNIVRKLNELYDDDQIEQKMWQKMRNAVVKEYHKLAENAPLPPAKQEEEKTNTTDPNQISNKPHVSPKDNEEGFKRETIEKHGYEGMTEHRKVEQTNPVPTPKKEEVEKNKLEDKMQESRRKHYEELRKVKERELELDLEFLTRQQEELERQRIEMEQNHVEHHNRMRW